MFYQMVGLAPSILMRRASQRKMVAPINHLGDRGRLRITGYSQACCSRICSSSFGSGIRL